MSKLLPSSKKNESGSDSFRRLAATEHRYLGMVVEKEEPFKYAVKLLEVFGFWMGRAPSKVAILYGIAIHLRFVDLCLLLQIIFLFTFEDYKDLVNLMSLLATFIVLFFGTINFMTKCNQIGKLLEMTEELLQHCPDTTKIAKRLKMAERIYKLMTCAAIFSCLVGAVSTVFELPYVMWFPYETENNSLGYWTSAAYQSIITTTLAPATINIFYVLRNRVLRNIVQSFGIIQKADCRR